MAIPKNMANVVALWIVHSHCFEEFTHSARLIITAPEKECGKTVLLSHLVGNLVSKPQHADNVTPAVFFRLAQSHKPTFLIDEVDSWLREDSQLPSALNGGFESHGRVLRCEGDNNEVREFSTFAPTAMAGINLLDKLPPPIISRSIVIELQRSLPGEVVENYDQRKHRKKLHTLRQMIADGCRTIFNVSMILTLNYPKVSLTGRPTSGDPWRLLPKWLAANGLVM